VSIKKVLVTGSSGTIGTRLCERLMVESGYQVVGADWEPNIWNEAVQAITIDADLRDPWSFGKLPTDVDVVIHLAANARVYDLVVDPGKARDNFISIYNVLEFCRQNNIPRVEFASSREVYGNSDAVLQAEDNVVLSRCESPYSASKMAGEALVHAYRECYGMEFITFRFSNVYGMYDRSDRVVPLFIRRCNAGENLTVFGKDKLLDFIYIDDAVDGICASLERWEHARNDVYNLAYGEGTAILALAEQVKELLGTNNKVILGEVRTGEVVKYIGDTSNAREKLLFAPKVPFSEGIIRSVRWYAENLP
jgi:UDP-glucose 4-epimerase